MPPVIQEKQLLISAVEDMVSICVMIYHKTVSKNYQYGVAFSDILFLFLTFWIHTPHHPKPTLGIVDAIKFVTDLVEDP